MEGKFICKINEEEKEELLEVEERILSIDSLIERLIERESEMRKISDKWWENIRIKYGIPNNLITTVDFKTGEVKGKEIEE